MRTIEAEGELTERDYMKAQWLHLKPRRPLLYVGYGLLFLIGIAAALAVGSSASVGDTTPAIGFFAVLGLFVILVLWQWLAYRRAYRSQRTLSGTQRLLFSESGIRGAFAYGAGETEWGAFIKWRESRDLFIIYQASNLMHIIPKRWFAGEQAVTDLRILLESHPIARIG